MREATARVLEPQDELLLPQLPLADFIRSLAEALPKLIEFVVSPALREHPVWGTAIPYHVPAYGTGTSLGHCIRPDVLLTADGPKICELDFVPSGRGYLLAGLGPAQQAEVLEVFAQWYRSMGASRILYATASTTMCRAETELFAAAMREYRGLDIHAGNIDDLALSDLQGVFIDRLSYRSEMQRPEEERSLAGLTVATAEPCLDSKAIFAMVHDGSLTTALEAALGKETLEFLRSVFPQTQLISRIKSDKELARLAGERTKWVLKNSDVETNHSWGCRGTAVGASYSETKFLEALMGGASLGAKDAGRNPVLQRWHASRDFWQIWDDVIKGVYQRAALVQPGKTHDPKTFCRATKEVGARIGFYFLVVRESGECLTTPYGDLVLRQDRLIHGASDAICLPVQAY